MDADANYKMILITHITEIQVQIQYLMHSHFTSSVLDVVINDSVLEKTLWLQWVSNFYKKLTFTNIIIQ